MYPKFVLIISLLFTASQYGSTQCNINVDAGPPQEICAPGGQVFLNGTIAGPFAISNWSPTTGLSDPEILDPVADVFMTTTYLLTAWNYDPSAPNLVQNPDFQAGNTGFTSEYTYADPTNPISLVPEGTYTVLTSPAAVHSAFPACVDHTSMDGTGMMMVVNGQTASVNPNIWCQSINTEPNTYYDLSAWISTIVPVSPAQLQFSINGIPVGNIFIASITSCSWNEFNTLWFSGSNTNIDLCITNQNNAGSGNDFAIDDISFTALCKVEDDVTISITTNPSIYINAAICSDDFYDLEGQIFNTPGLYEDISIIDSYGCEQLYDLELEFIDIVVTDIFNAELTCAQDTVEISVDAFPSHGILFYDWFTSNGNIISNPTRSFIEVDQPGIYRLVITAEHGSELCDTTLFFDVTENIINIVSAAGPDGIIDCDNPIYMLDGSGSSTGPDIIYLWSDTTGSIISNNLIPNINTAGLYYLTVVDTITQCSNIDSALITTSGSLPIANAGPDGFIDCNNLSFLFDSGGSTTGTGFDYTWRDSSGNIISNDLINSVNNPGLYSLTVENTANGCFNIDTVIVADNIIIPMADAGPDGVIDCNNPAYLLDPSGSSMGSDLVYTWRDSLGNIISNNLIHSVVNAGLYSLNVADTSNGCVDIDTVGVTGSGDIPRADAGPDGVIDCANPSFTFDASDSSTGSNIAYSWMDTMGNTISNNLIHSVNNAGIFILTVENNINGCTIIDSVEVVASQDLPQISAGIDTILNCGIDEFTIQPIIQNSSPDDIISWTTPDGNISSTSNITDANVTQSGLYIISVNNIVTTCSNIDSIYITFMEDLPAPTFNLPDTITCSRTSIELNAQYPGDLELIEFSWSNINNSFNLIDDTTIQVLDSGLYILTVRNDLRQCLTSSSIYVHKNIEDPTANAGFDDQLNCNDTIQLNGTLSSSGINFNYSWTSIDGNIIGPTDVLAPFADRAGSYILTVWDMSNGCMNSDTVLITSNQILPEILFNQPDTINCNQESIFIHGSTNNNIDSFSYLWESNDGNIISNNNNDSIFVDQAGTYRLTITNTNTNCSNSSEIEIYDNLLSPTIDAGPDMTLSCEETTVQLNGSILETISTQINWISTDGNIISGAQTLEPLVDRPGVYTLTVRLNNGCFSTDSLEVFIDQDIPLSIIANTSSLNCFNEEITLDASLSSQGDVFQSSWSGSTGSFIDSSNIYMPRINSPGSYILTITNLTNDCISSDTISVLQDTISPTPEIIFNDLTCLETTSIIDASNSYGAHNLLYIWSGNIMPSPSTSPILTTAQAGTYNLELIDSINGCSTQLDIEVEADYNTDNLIIDLPSTYQATLGQEILLNAQINFDSDLITQINWSNSALLKDRNSLNPIACPSSDTDFTLQISIGEFCETTAQTQIKFILSEIFVPSIFTPDSDGTNDGFTIYGGPDILQIDEMVILNRWGDIVYKNQGFLPNNPELGWDGRFKSALQNTGVYIYQAKVRYQNNQIVVVQGDITLLR